MANLYRDRTIVKKVKAKLKSNPKLESFDMSHIKINFFDVLKAIHDGKAITVLDTSTGDPVLITSKMYQQLLKVA